MYVHKGGRYTKVDLTDIENVHAFTVKELGNNGPGLWHARIDNSIQLGYHTREEYIFLKYKSENEPITKVRFEIDVPAL